ncbi:hypothetical protein N7478_010676 [Penicillium angulare]|uniref:uncharacterized protein n=1 Tax=Penicillium angulare TaxID=116970 RepID=UPI00253F8909|nr:uncharacterized protein N7478_010676 [Penicillium angulare]KAJ5267868.1 hypothetical protein N7478_010676 [Penicillium angulare]
MDVNHLINEHYAPLLIDAGQQSSHSRHREMAAQAVRKQPDESNEAGSMAAPSVPLKLPIPRLRNSTSYVARRITCACSSCRASKTRCTGESPRCQRCALLHYDCQYPEKKSLEMQRKLAQVLSEAHDYKNVLRLLLKSVNVQDAELISAVLSKYNHGHDLIAKSTSEPGSLSTAEPVEADPV